MPTAIAEDQKHCKQLTPNTEQVLQGLQEIDLITNTEKSCISFVLKFLCVSIILRFYNKKRIEKGEN